MEVRSSGVGLDRYRTGRKDKGNRRSKRTGKGRGERGEKLGE
jgi:hypothetical protein